MMVAIDAWLNTVWPPETWVFVSAVRSMHFFMLVLVIARLIAQRRLLFFAVALLGPAIYLALQLYLIVDELGPRQPATAWLLWKNAAYSVVWFVGWVELGRKRKGERRVPRN